MFEFVLRGLKAPGRIFISRRRPRAAARDNFFVQVSRKPSGRARGARAISLSADGRLPRGFKWSSLTLHSRQRLPVQLPFILAEEENWSYWNFCPWGSNRVGRRRSRTLRITISSTAKSFSVAYPIGIVSYSRVVHFCGCCTSLEYGFS